MRRNDAKGKRGAAPEAQASAGAPRVPGEDPRLGQRYGSYRIMGLLGTGAAGTVYRAEHEVIGKPVAIKVLHPRMMKYDSVRTRFLVEARAASLLRHPGIVDVTDFGTAPDGCPFLVMELVRGIRLDREIDRVGALPAARALNILAQTCRAVHACHEAGVVHRDLKPENILLIQDVGEEPLFEPASPAGALTERVKILDFGLASVRAHTARLDAESERNRFVAGSPCFMSPEQVQGRTGDARSDLYSLGVILFEMLTGDVPFYGDTAEEVMQKHVKFPVPSMRKRCPDLSIPAEAENVMHTAMAKRPEDRYQSARSLLAAVSRCFKEVQLAEPRAEAPPDRKGTAVLGSGADGLNLLRRRPA